MSWFFKQCTITCTVKE